jgi:methionyl aminopeptidase
MIYLFIISHEVICHGIPDMRPLQNGDLCNVDVTVYHRGFHGDLNETLFIGEVDEKSKELTRVTYEALMKAIDIGSFYYVYFIMIFFIENFEY